MRVLVATPLYPPEPGGPATYARLLERMLPEEGIEVSLLAFAGVRRYPKVVRHIVYFFQAFKALKDADIVLALDPVSTGFPSLIAARLRRKKFVVKVVGDYAWEQGSQRFGIRRSLDEFTHERAEHPVVLLFRAVQSLVARSADAVVVPSVYLKRIIRTWKVSDERIAVIYNAVELGEMGKVPEAVSALLRPRIVTAGRLVPWKGMGTVIDAVNGLRSQIPEASLGVIGAGPEEDALTRYAAVRLAGGYAFTGALTHADVLATINDADVFVLDSTYEGLSHLLIEALSLGKPVIASNVGGNVELIKDGVNGLLVPPKDPQALMEACARMFTDDALRASLGAEALGTRERFSAEALVHNTKALLTALV